MSTDPLLQPFQLKHLTLRNRIVITSHEPAYSEDWMPKERYRRYHEERARGGAWRTQESTLHVLSLIGGWPGALIAQQVLRHKSKKKEFRFVFWLTVVINVGVFLWLFIDSGSAMLAALLEQ